MTRFQMMVQFGSHRPLIFKVHFRHSESESLGEGGRERESEEECHHNFVTLGGTLHGMDKVMELFSSNQLCKPKHPL